MTDSPRTSKLKVAFLIAWGLLAASAAMAGFPDPSNFECRGTPKNYPLDQFIQIVGHDGVVGDPQGEFCVVARDLNNVPVPNLPIVIDFSNCDIQLCVDQKDPGVSVDCVSHTVRKTTDANGFACFRVIGKRRGASCASQPNPCAAVYGELAGNRFFVCTLRAAVYDLVNEAGVGMSGNDLSEFLHLFFDCGLYLGQIDYNSNVINDGDDLSMFLKTFFLGGSALNCDPPADPETGPKCP